VPAILFAATCLTTWFVGSFDQVVFAVQRGVPERIPLALLQGLKYAVPLMTILICHEMGHFVQARRYRVPATLPFFIPMPLPPLGTMGAVIAMDSRMGNRKALFDIGITGPLAGLAPTLIFCVVGLSLSGYTREPSQVGYPLLFEWLAQWILGPKPPGECIAAHPVAFAGWVGLLLTALNLIPIGQLDGGHILYGLFRRRANAVAALLLYGAILAIIWFRLFQWTLMIFLLLMLGTRHPPTADDQVRLGPVRIVLGVLTLLFIPIGFTPTPFVLSP
jgi:membrane-associated protease RseP (regulator of RpoE activity)